MTNSLDTGELRFCPRCGNKTLVLIEVCDTGDPTEEKTSWACHSQLCDEERVVVYIYRDIGEGGGG